MANIAADHVNKAAAFYRDLLDLSLVMDLGWIATFAASGLSSPQISIAVEGGSGTPVPDVSIEVDDVDKTYARATRTVFEIPYDITTEPWGMRRFHVRDPLHMAHRQWWRNSRGFTRYRRAARGVAHVPAPQPVQHADVSAAQRRAVHAPATKAMIARSPVTARAAGNTAVVAVPLLCSMSCKRPCGVSFATRVYRTRRK